MLPSASLGGKVGLYEPSHGSAPDITGTGKANPLATILSVSMMLKYSFHLNKESQAIEDAVEKALGAGLRTADLAQKGEKYVSCEEMGAAVLNHLKAK
jgi:3-isopropylmalate dehydrogenase